VPRSASRGVCGGLDDLRKVVLQPGRAQRLVDLCGGAGIDADEHLAVEWPVDGCGDLDKLLLLHRQTIELRQHDLLDGCGEGLE